MTYYRRRERSFSRRHGQLEWILSALVIVLVIAVLEYFLVVYHDLPLRITGGSR